jgi:hypothetical protein
MSDPRIRLRDKLCREIAQAEHDARIHTRREAGRLGDVAPGRALLAISEHATEIEPVLAKLTHQPVGLHIARAVADVFSAARHFFFDRLIDSERSYRATLLGLKHGIDATRLLREVVTLTNDIALLKFCDLVLVERLCLIEDAEQALSWFAENSALALKSGGRRLTLPAPDTQAAAAVFAVKL